MSWVWFVVLLQVWDGESHIQVPNVFDGDHIVELLEQKKNNKNIPMDITKEDIHTRIIKALIWNSHKA